MATTTTITSFKLDVLRFELLLNKVDFGTRTLLSSQTFPIFFFFSFFQEINTVILAEILLRRGWTKRHPSRLFQVRRLGWRKRSANIAKFNFNSHAFNQHPSNLLHFRVFDKVDFNASASWYSATCAVASRIGKSLGLRVESRLHERCRAVSHRSD